MEAGFAVEFCGLPGSGKTTVARQTRARLVCRGVECRVADLGISAAADPSERIRRRTASGVRETARHPLSTAAAALAVAGSHQASHRDAVAALAQWLAVRDLVRLAHAEAGVHLFEEGILQRLWTLGLRAERDVSARLLAGLPAPYLTDLVVVLDVSVTLVDARLETRSSRHSRTQALTGRLRIAELERGHELLERLLAAAPVPVVRLAAGSATPEELASTAAAAVLGRLVGDRGRQ